MTKENKTKLSTLHLDLLDKINVDFQKDRINRIEREDIEYERELTKDKIYYKQVMYIISLFGLFILLIITFSGMFLHNQTIKMSCEINNPKDFPIDKDKYDMMTTIPKGQIKCSGEYHGTVIEFIKMITS